MKNFVGGNIPAHSLPHKNLDGVSTNTLYLSDLSDRDKLWDKHRRNSDRIANYYRGLEEFQRYAERIDSCARLLDFRLIVDELESGYRLKLYMAQFCRVKNCPTCQWRRSLMWKMKAYQVLPMIVDDYPKYRWLFLTLTVRNCLINELREALQIMNKSWQRMVQRKKFPAIGWIRSTEVTRGKDGFAHPHFHCLLLVKPSYFGYSYIKQEAWVEIWRSCLRANYDPVVDIRAVRRDSHPNELIPEILKYCVKEVDLVANREWFLELTRQMYRMRTIATGGVLKDYLKQLEEEPEDLIGKDELKTESELDEGHLYFEWKYQEKRYKLK